MAALEPAGRGGLAASGAPPIDGEAAFVAVADGLFRLEAPLTFASVPALRLPGLQRIQAAAQGLQFDLQRVTATDSAGLALLIDWLAEARARACTLHYVRPPESLLNLARLSEVEPLLSAAPAAQGSDSGRS